MTKASDLFIQCLEEEGVEYVFGVPGEENLDFLDSLSRSKTVKLILTRHEQGAGFMAATYGRHTGKYRRLPRHAGAGRDQLRHRRRLCAIGRHADADDHRPEADQEIEAGPLPDPRRRRHDGADHQVHPPARQRRQHPEPGARGLPPRRGGEAGRHPYRIPRGYRRGEDGIGAAEAQPRPPPARRREIGPRRGGAARGGEIAGPRHRRRRQPQDDQPDAAPADREDRHPLHHHPARQGRDRRGASQVPRLRGAVGRRLRPQGARSPPTSSSISATT